MHLELDTHYEPCRFTPERVALYVKSAQTRGISEIGITEHCNRFKQFRPFMDHLLLDGTTEECVTWRERSFREELDDYVEALVQAKQSGLPVKVSLEVDFIPEHIESIRDVLSRYPWDYVLGSVHFLGSWGIDMDPGYGWPEADVDAVYRKYFETLAAAASSGLFDVLAHPDLVKKFGHTPTFSVQELYDDVARRVKEADVAIEISTAGLHKTVGEMYPSEAFLRRFYEHGVPITLASDAHTPEHIGRDFDQAIALARRVGYEEIVTFNRRSRQLVAIG